jgi:hypothetical protein
MLARALPRLLMTLAVGWVGRAPTVFGRSNTHGAPLSAPHPRVARPPAQTQRPGTLPWRQDTASGPASREIERLLGPIPSSANVRALGGPFARYESDFVKFDEPQWALCRAKWDCLDYYDRAMIYYVWWQRTGDSKYRDRANQVALNYRQFYLEANKFGIAHHWSMTDGVALHYLVTGDPASLTAISRMGEYWAYTVNADPSGYFVPTQAFDQRIMAYSVKGLLAAYALNAPSNGANGYGWPVVSSWSTALRTALNKILAARDPDGQWRTHKTGCVNGYQPFVIGLLYDELIRYYEHFEADPRIPAAIQTSAEQMWREAWRPGAVNASSNVQAPAFVYVSGNCSAEGGPTPAGDLNQLIVNGYGWTYKMTGNTLWKARADSVFAGGVSFGGVTGDSKHFNQQYTSSYRYLSWRFLP